MSLVRYDIHDTTAVLTLDDPARRNAISLAMVEEFIAALEKAEADDSVSAVVVTGAGPAFCAGAELGHLAQASDEGEAAAQALLSVYRVFLRLDACPLPTIAVVNGPAVGAGMNMALACDIRLAGESARFATRFLALGLHPGGGHTWMLRRAAGPQAAMAAVLLGEELSGEQAARTGLAWRCVPDGQLLTEAVTLAARAAAAPRDVLIQAKHSIRDMAGVASYDDAVERELPRQLWSAQQDEFRRRIAKLTAST